VGRYLQIVESHYPVPPPGAELDRVREAATAYVRAVQRGRVEARGIAKVVLIEREGERRVEEMPGVLRCEHPLHRQAWIEALPSPHERYVAEMHHALRGLGAERGWDGEALEAAYRRVVGADHRFAGVHVAPRWNRDRSCALGVEWVTADEVRCRFVVARAGRGEDRVTFMTSPIGLGKIEGVTTRLVWENDARAVLWHRNRRDRWRIDTRTLDVDFVYGPAEDGPPHGQYALGRMYLDGGSWAVRDPRKAIFWLERAACGGFERARTLLAGLPRSAGG